MIHVYRRELLLITLCILGLFLVDHFYVKESLVYLNVNPNPYLVVSILIAGFYGLNMAIISSLALSTAYLLILHLNVDYNDVETLIDFKYLSVPLAMCSVSIVIGELRQKNLDKINTLSKELDLQANQIGSFYDKEQLLAREMGELKKKLVSKLDTAKSFYDMALRLHSFNQEELLENFLEVLRTQLKVSEAHIYKIDETNAKAQLVSYLKEAPFNKNLVSISELEPLSVMAYERKSMVTIKDWLRVENIRHDQYEDNKDIALLSLPLGTDNKVEYLLVIKNMPFLEFVPSNFALLEIYAEWLSGSLKHAQEYHKMKESSVWNQDLQIYRYSHIRDRLLKEFGRAKESLDSLVLCRLKLNGIESCSERKSFVIKKTLCTLCTQKIRGLDFVGEGKDPDSLLLVFPMNDVSKVKKLVSEVEEKFSQIGISTENFNPKIKSTIYEFSPEMKNIHEFAGELI